MTGKLVIRNAAGGDLMEIRRLVRDVLREYGLPYDDRVLDTDLRDLDEAYWLNGGSFEVLQESGGAIVGTLGLASKGPRICELRRMYLLPRWRGAGLGKALLSRGIDKARSMGFEVMVLETAASMDAARALYSSFGFERTDDSPGDCGCDRVMSLALEGCVLPKTRDFAEAWS